MRRILRSCHRLALLAAVFLLLALPWPAAGGAVTLCGDGVVTPGLEECDDGNTLDGDGCSSACACEAGECGDGTRHCYELCDDGNATSGDGCSPYCIPETCGDDVLEVYTEDCDDGNTSPGDGCAADCSCEPEVCGDGVQGCTELCDDGNTLDGDGCGALCGAVCGDGVEEGNESCDDGNTLSCDGCGPYCVPDECGDEILSGCGEECDDGNTAAGDGCAADCTCEPEVCGDGIPGCTEECDDGNTVNGDGCESNCTSSDPCLPITKLQKACIRAMNRSLASVVDAQNADDAACVRKVAAGKTLAIDDCLGEDVAGKVARAEARTTSTDGKKCQPPKGETPPLAYTAPATVNGAGKVEPLEAAASVLGLAPNVVPKSSDAAGAACQAEVMKQLGALATRWAAEAIKAKTRALEGGKPPGASSPACNNAEVAAAIDAAIGSSLPLAAAEAKAIARITRKCTNAQVAAGLFACNGAATVVDLAACVVAAAEEGACNAFEVADGLALGCPTPPVFP